jgi:murein L,D-transpeptidase YafK
MAPIRGYIFFSIRLLTALLLAVCLSPLPDNQLPAAPAANSAGYISIVIWKSHYTLTLYQGDHPVKTYRAVFGKGYQDGDKRRQGDKRTPEGDFYICTMNNSKRFYKFLGLSYPSLRHADYGLQTGVISPNDYLSIKKALEERQQPPWETQLGGAVGIHGGMPVMPSVPLSLDIMNWTDGCIALADSDVDELFSVVTIGTPVRILP